MSRYSLILLPRQGLLMQTITSMVLFTFTWLLVHPTLLAAQPLAYNQAKALPRSASAEIALADTLEQIETQLTRLHIKLTQAEDTRLEEDDLMRLRKRLEHLDTRARQAFDRIGQRLKDKGAPAEILRRHQAMVTTYEAELTTLRRNLDAFSASSSDAMRRDQATQALRHL
jgi:chromosome segregation ATPase